MNINNNKPYDRANNYPQKNKKEKLKINMAEVDIEMKAQNIYKNTKNYNLKTKNLIDFIGRGR